MCGIVGLIDPAPLPIAIPAALQEMTGAIVHRGPDDDGFFVAPGIGLGMRRLSIIDVAGGQQPIANEDGTIQVVFNGEIYNYLELRTGLEARGHRFQTRSDTEVIAHLYEEQGERCFEALRGMFAIALWDVRRHRLVLGRDRMGKKPIFYAQIGERLLFGSEIKSILAVAPELAEPAPEAILPYFRYGFVPEPGTMYRHIYKLPAAHYLVYDYDQQRLTIAPYWQIPFGEIDTVRSHQQWIEELDALLEEAVRIRLMSEVPLGIFLSGGLDSSTIVAYARKAGLHPIKTFTIGFDRPDWDESADAALVARHFDTDHHVLTLREQEFARTLPETVLHIVRHVDEPFGDSSALPTYHVSKLAREHVTVILSGDGGDELFAGYTSYQGARFAEYYRYLPPAMRHALPALLEVGARAVPVSQRYRLLRAAKVMNDSALPFEVMYFSKMASGNSTLLPRIFRPEAFADLPRRADWLRPPAILAALQSSQPTVSRLGYADMRFRLLDDMLVKVDRMSMAASLEVRSPLLDHRLVELAARMPAGLKLRGWEKKAILRDTVRGYLPPAILRKRKQGFAVPLRDWLRNELYPMARDYLSQLPAELFDQPALQKLLAEHRRAEADHSPMIWLLLNYAAWYDLYVSKRTGVNAPAAR